MSSSKKKLLVGFAHDYAARDYIDTGILSELKKSYELLFITTPEQKCDLSSFGRIIAIHQMTYWRLRIWMIAFGLRHLWGYEPIIRTQPDKLRVFQRGRSGKIKFIVHLFYYLGLSGPVSRLLEKFLRWTTPNFIDLNERLDVALLPSGMNDYFWDDVVSFCKRHRIPSLTVTINWDNIAHKVFLQQPDWLGVWGEQGYLFARLMQRVPAQKIFTIGNPRFETYVNSKVSKDEARQTLGIDPEKRVLLFAGAGVVFDEVSLLNELELACEKGKLPQDLLIIYKPHPKRHQRAHEPALLSHYKFIKVLEKTMNGLGDYPALLKASDGLISPLSTMVLEGAFMGLPALGLAYDHPNHGDYSWNNARLNNHLHPILMGKWFVPCFERVDFIGQIHELLRLMKDPRVESWARSTTDFILHTDERGFVWRVIKALESISSPIKS
ncbi:MAG: CDP-glycerol glycerophosphotransferase family protein [Oligoflexia bacterium]|nr:CDP-glycerol glycerophosphotransferase family protein [Oligoflexia bacterium]